MRVIVFFDLPNDSTDDRREYNRFRKYLIKNGFVMNQESVYSKIVLNNTACEVVKNGLRKNKTKKGLVQVLTVTEKQFSAMEVLVGHTQTEVIDSSDKLVVL